MKKKTLGIIQIVLLVVAIVYLIAPDLVVGPFDDAAVVGILGCVEFVLAILRARYKDEDSIPNSGNSYYQYSNQNTYSNSNNYSQSYQHENTNQETDKQDDEFQFFAGCNTWEDVKLRYRDLMKIYHPDAGGNEDASKRINAEYNALKAKFGK